MTKNKSLFVVGLVFASFLIAASTSICPLDTA